MILFPFRLSIKFKDCKQIIVIIGSIFMVTGN